MSEIEKLTRIARMARPDLMYDVFEAAQVFQKREIIKDDSKHFVSEEESKEELQKAKEEDFPTCPDF